MTYLMEMCRREGGGLFFLTRWFNTILERVRGYLRHGEKCTCIVFKKKVDVQSCSNHRGIMLLSHTMKKWNVDDARIRRQVAINEHDFLLRKSATDVMFALRVMEKYREGLKELHFIFLGLEKADDRV